MGFRAAIALYSSFAALCLIATPSIAQTPGEPGTVAAPATTPAAADSTVVPPAMTPVVPPAPAVPPASGVPPAAAVPAAQQTPPPAQQTPPPAPTPPAAAPTPPAAAPTPPAAAPTPPPPAKSASPSGAFGRGRTRASFTAGWGRSFSNDYLLVGVGLGRFIKTGLELRLNYEAWIGSDPGVSKLTPQINLVLTRVPRMTPYFGAFYTRAFIDGVDNLNSVGGRAGIYRGRGRATYGAGAVFEKYLNFDTTIYGGDSWTIYPEVFVSASF